MAIEKSLLNFLSTVGACNEAKDWADEYASDYKRAWDKCERGDWLLWIAARAGVDRKLVVHAACAVARTSLQYVKDGEDRPRLCLEVTESWCDGTATVEEVRTARRDAAAYAAYAADAAAYAAYAAAYAAYAADADAAYAAAYADADAAYADADAAYAAAYADADADAAYADAAYAAADAAYAARKRSFACHANIVRGIISYHVIMAAVEAKGA